MSIQVKPYNPAHMLNALFEPSGNESKVPKKTSRYIVAKNLAISPLRCPMNGILLGSSPKQRMRQESLICSSGKVERGALYPAVIHPVEEKSVAEPLNQSKLRAEPSDAAKAFLDRIPDLSYMLSSEFSPPAAVSAIN
jgi:hypothetical protein